MVSSYLRQLGCIFRHQVGKLPEYACALAGGKSGPGRLSSRRRRDCGGDVLLAGGRNGGNHLAIARVLNLASISMCIKKWFGTYSDVKGFGALPVDELSVDKVPGLVFSHDSKCKL
jgi:hypothetical protein